MTGSARSYSQPTPDHIRSWWYGKKARLTDASGWRRASWKGSARMKPVDGDEAIRILQRMVDAREKNCARSAKIEQGALRMAIEVIRQLPEIQPEDK